MCASHIPSSTYFLESKILKLYYDVSSYGKNNEDSQLRMNAVKIRDPIMTIKHVCTEDEPLQPSSEQ
jgi:hypothetical protein